MSPCGSCVVEQTPCLCGLNGPTKIKCKTSFRYMPDDSNLRSGTGSRRTAYGNNQAKNVATKKRPEYTKRRSQIVFPQAARQNRHRSDSNLAMSSFATVNPTPVMSRYSMAA